MQLTKNFKLQEFEISHEKHGFNEYINKIPDELLDNIHELALNLQIVRDLIDLPIRITSGYRSEEYNEKVGGAYYSQHKLAKAVDIRVKGKSPKDVHDLLYILMKFGVIKAGGLKQYSTFVHYDIRGKYTTWN